jgi:hypothetical protein
MSGNIKSSVLLQRLRRILRKRLRRIGLKVSNMSPAERERIQRRLRSTPLFNPEDYLALHKEVAQNDNDPFEHFMETGLKQGRQTLRAHGVARILHDLDQRFDAEAAAYMQAFEAAQNEPGLDAFASAAKVVIAVHSQANYYMRPIAEALRHALEAAGCPCRLVDERDPELIAADFPIVVAPHEFFSMPGPAALRERNFLSRAILFNTEQMPSKWFAETLRWAYFARAVIDVNFQTALAFGASFPALHILPPFDDAQVRASHGAHDPSHPAFNANPAELYEWAFRRPILDRAFDVFFAGFRTPERSRFFVRSAAYLAAKHCFLAYSTLPPAASRLDASTRAIFPTNISVARNSRIILSIHRYALGFFEWERMVAQGFATGACVIATPSLRSPFFQPGIHYFETISRNLDKLVRWVLDTDEGMKAAQAAADEAHKVLEAQLTASRVGRRLVSFLRSLETDVHVGS